MSMVNNLLLDESSDVIPSTPEVVKKKRIVKCKTKPSLNEFFVTDELEERVVHGSTLSDRYKCPYTFFEILDISGFNKCYQPSNSYVKTLGVYSSNSRSHFLSDYKCDWIKNKNLHISLDFSSVNVLPNSRALIEVYGFISFSGKVFMVQFWTEVSTVNVQRYLSCLVNKKSYMPLQYKEVKKR